MSLTDSTNTDKFVLNFAPTGMVPTHKDSPHVPMTPTDIAEQTHQAYELGITVVHLHARNTDGQPSHDIDIYADIIERIRSFSQDLVICVSLSGREKPDFDSRSTPLRLDGDLKPDMGSLTLSSLNFSKQASMNAPDMVQALAREMNARGIVPELEAFDSGMINYARYLIRKGLVSPPYYFNLLMGNPANAQADPLSLGAMLAQLPGNSLWSAGGIGATQFSSAALGLASGGGVRIGLEDNLYMDRKRTCLANNVQLIKVAHTLAEQLERRVMTPKEFRTAMNLSSGNGSYGRPN